MKTFYSAGYFKRPVLFLLLSFINIFVFAASAFALTGNKIDQCYDCHGSPVVPGPSDNRPLDGTYRNISSGAVVGNHRTHMAPSATVAACVSCHVSSGFTVDHRNGKISFQSNINTSPATGKYMKYGFQAFTSSQVSNPTLGTCATVNCHFETVSPTWGTSSSLTTCDTCHSSQPSTLSHTKHESYYGGTGSCVKCHPARPVFSHATSAGDRALTLIPSVNYAGSNNQYLPSQAATRVVGNCSNLYCHSDGTKSSAPFTGSTNPTWGATLTCSSCHGDAATLNTNSHAAHIRNASVIGVNITCDKCHNTTTNNGTTIASTAVHDNQAIDVAFPGGVGSYSTTGHAPGGAVGTCSATYCHSSGRTGVAAPTAPTWGSTWTNKCNGCHGTSNSVGSPDYTNGGKATTTANSHATHAITKGIGCAVCHNQTTTTGNTITGTRHLDSNNQDVYFGNFGTISQSTATYTGGTTKSCSNTYCHMSAVPVWGDTLLTNCTSCHGGNSTTGASEIVTGAHRAHIDPSYKVFLGSGNGLGCAACHAKTVSNDTTISAAGQINHSNGFKDFSGAKAPKQTVNGGTCTTYCHSNGKGTSANPPTWTAATALNCDGCHGIGTGTGAPNNSTPNSHPKHAPTASDCYKCHANTADPTIAGKIRDNTTSHIDTIVDSRLSKIALTNYSGVYNTSNKTCSATYCHGGTVTTPAWGTVGGTNCNSCHKAKSSTVGLPAGHAFHLMSTAGNYSYTNAAVNTSTTTAYNFTCSSCHGATITNHAKGPQVSGSDADIFFGFSSSGRGASATSAYVRQTASTSTDAQGFKYTPGGAGNCNNTYCHSNGNNSNGYNTAITWTSTQSAPGGSCTTCHGDATTVGSLLNTNYHQNHVNKASTGGNLGCVECHAKTVTNNTTISNKANHINKFKDYSGAKAPKASLAADGTCSTYCHSSGQATPTLRTVTSWRTAGTTYTCKNCHGADTYVVSQYGEPNYQNISSLKNSWNSHSAKHISSAASCANCHVATTADGLTIKAGAPHLDMTRNVAFDTTNSRIGTAGNYDAVNKTCSNVNCHSNGKGIYATPRWGGRMNCKACHPTLGGAHARHMGGFNGSNGVPDWGNLPYYQYTSNKSNGIDTDGTTRANYAFGCANCHPIDPNMHADGTIEVQVNNIAGVSTLRSKNSAPVINGSVGTNAITCSGVYCHSDGKGGQTTTLSWGSTFNGLDRCAQCHGNSPTSTGAHAAHVVGIHSDDIFNGTSGKLSAGSGGTVSVSHGDAAQATTLNCNICHAATVTNSRNYQNASCSTTGCHPTATEPAIRTPLLNIANHVTGNVLVSFQAVNFKSKAQLRAGSFVNYTGGVAGWKRNQVAGADQYKTGVNAFDVAKNPLTVINWNSTNKSCSNVVCHNMKSGQSVLWTDTLTCDSCHSSL